MVNDTHCIYCGEPTTPLAEGVNECEYCESLVATENGYTYESNYHAYRFSWFRPKLPFLAIKALRSGLRRNLIVCDIGCGAGHSMLIAKWFGCTTVGHDIKEAEPYVRGCHSFISNPELLRQVWRNACDLVWCWHTLEHTNEPRELLDLCFTLLAPGGEAWIEFPDAVATHASVDRDKLKQHCLFPEHRGLPSRTWALRELIEMGASAVTVQTPRNPCWLYGRLDKKNDVVLRVKKRNIDHE